VGSKSSTDSTPAADYGANEVERVVIPQDAGPGGSYGWHHVISRVLEKGPPRLRANLMWQLDRHEYAPTKAVLRRFVGPGDVVLDIGANWGLITDRLADRVGPEGRVLAFEPNPVPLRTLRDVADRHENVAVYPVALSDAERTVELHVPVSPAHGVLRRRTVHPMATVVPRPNRWATHYATVRVTARRLDDIVDEGLMPSAPAFVKCDVEGHELAVLRGATALLRRSRPTIFIEIEQRHQETPIGAIFALLDEHGYDGYVLDHTRLRPLAEFDVQRDQLAFLRPNALFAAPPPGYLFEFVFVASA
jgi:FkbM family methyltransferase